MALVTCKFGGSSLADAACIRAMESIVRSNPDRRFIVPSAPGKRNPDDRKITDLLYAWFNMAKEGFDASEPRSIIADRFLELAQALGVKFEIQKHLDEIAAEVGKYDTPDYMASRGEYLNGRLIAELLDATFVDPAECIRFTEGGHFDTASYEALGARLKGEGLFVVPGFYGSLPDGQIKTFSRGGSDITGSIVARASESGLYENWTDVSGFRMADPRMVPDAKRIEEITYQELRELSYMGASVLHDEAIFPVRDTGIPIHIRNTKAPEAPGTKIVSSRAATQPVVGVAGRSGFTMINIEKTFMNKEKGFGLRVLQVLEEHGVSWEHMPTGIDTISLIISEDQLGHQGQDIMAAIEKRCDTDRIGLSKGLAIIATVGQGMNHHVGVAARLFTAIADAGINLQVIDQGSSEMNIIIGVDEEDLAGAVNAIYKAFENQE